MRTSNAVRSPLAALGDDVEMTPLWHAAQHNQNGISQVVEVRYAVGRSPRNDKVFGEIPRVELLGWYLFGVEVGWYCTAGLVAFPSDER